MWTTSFRMCFLVSSSNRPRLFTTHPRADFAATSKSALIAHCKSADHATAAGEGAGDEGRGLRRAAAMRERCIGNAPSLNRGQNRNRGKRADCSDKERQVEAAEILFPDRAGEEAGGELADPGDR